MKWITICCLSILIVGCKKQSDNSVFSVVDTGLGTDIEKVVFLDDTLGYLCGGDKHELGILAVTTNSGTSWQKKELFFENERKLYDLSFVNDSVGYAGMEYNFYYRTTNRGNKWLVDWLEGTEVAYHPVNRPSIRRFKFIDSDNLYFVGGENYEVGVFHRSTDGGDIWLFDTLKHELRGIDFYDKNNGFIGGYGYLARTKDAGNTLEQLDLVNNFIVAIKMFSVNEVVCISQNGGIFRTEDGGDSWETVQKPNGAFGKRYFFNDMHFFNATDGYISGYNGVLLKSVDKGKNWTEVPSPVDTELKRISSLGNRIYIGTTNGRYIVN